MQAIPKLRARHMREGVVQILKWGQQNLVEMVAFAPYGRDRSSTLGQLRIDGVSKEFPGILLHSVDKENRRAGGRK